MGSVKRLPARDQVTLTDTWDLSSLYADDATWQQDLKRLQTEIDRFASFRGRLAESAAVLAECLQFDCDFDRLAERLGVYSMLKSSEDQANPTYQAMRAQFQSVAARASEAASFIRPEIMEIPTDRMQAFLADEVLQPFRLVLERVLRYQPYTLSQREERLLAMQAEMSQAAQQAFRQLMHADLKFGTVENEKGEQVELSNATFSALLVSPQRTVRETAFHRYYAQFEAHENTFAATLAGSIHRDIYYARARGYESALQSALFADHLPLSVYTQLIDSVHEFLPVLHRYYDLRRRKMDLPDLHMYDTYVPILSDLETNYTWDQAVDVVIESLRPLGADYTRVLEQGLRGRWCDRYPNLGKQSGAFSCGSFDGDPYILMNYQPTVLNDVYTLAHEAGHSMHSYHSARHQPFQYHDYSIFVAEVASTFNEELLSHHLLSHTNDRKWRTYLINRAIDDIRGTIFRQTMFAEFEKEVHEQGEAGQPLTLGTFRETYRQLLDRYFGPAFALDDCLSLECLRIPHFYRAFYVFKYATGLSAAIALSQRVLHGGRAELNDYLGFLCAGCSREPLDLLRDAGVDMASPQPVRTALEHFESLVNELDSLLSTS